MTTFDLKIRTKEFAIDTVKFIKSLPNDETGRTIKYQLVKSATSVAANYSAVCRARSDREFIAKLQIVLEESDESHFWFEMINELSLSNQTSKNKYLLKEADELTSIFVTSLKKIKARSK